MSKSMKSGLFAMLGAGVVFAAVDADAAYSGSTIRNLCGAGAVPVASHRSYFDVSGCNATVTDTGTPTAYHYAALPVPWDRASGSGNDTVWVDFYANCTSPRQACGQFIFTDVGGTIQGSTSSQCIGSGGYAWYSISLNSNYQVHLSMAGQNSCSFHSAHLGFTANGN